MVFDNITIQDIIYNLPGMRFCKDLSYRYQGISKQLLTFAGKTTDSEVIGKTDSDLPWNRYTKTYQATDAEVLLGNEIVSFNKMVTASQQEIDIIIKKMPMKNRQNQIIGLIGSIHLTGDLYNTSAADWNFPGLSTRESQCLFFLFRGKSIKQIAKQMSLSPRTVEHYLDNVKIKLNASTKAKLFETGFKRNWLNVTPH